MFDQHCTLATLSEARNNEMQQCVFCSVSPLIKQNLSINQHESKFKISDQSSISTSYHHPLWHQ